MSRAADFLDTMERCPCCRFKTLEKLGDDEICPVCFWHDDAQTDAIADEVWGGPNDLLSLTEARGNYIKC